MHLASNSVIIPQKDLRWMAQPLVDTRLIAVLPTPDFLFNIFLYRYEYCYYAKNMLKLLMNANFLMFCLAILPMNNI